MNLKDIKHFRFFNGVMQVLIDGVKGKYMPLPIAINGKKFTTSFKVNKVHINQILRVDSATPVDVTINNKDFRVGHFFNVEQTGLGTVTIVTDGSTLNGNPSTSEQFHIIQVIKMEEGNWSVVGGVL